MTTPSEPNPNLSQPAPAAAPTAADFTRAMDVSSGRIADWLRRVRKTARTMLVAQRIGWIVAGAILAVIVGGFADYFLRAPMQLRLLGLLAAVGVLVWCFARFLIPAVRFRPSLTEIALRVEKSRSGEGADVAGVRGLLASALELGRTESSPRTQALAVPVVAEAAEKLTRIKAREVFSSRPTLRAVGAGVAAFLLFFGLSVTWPHLTQIGLARMLFPWTSAQWPKHTEIADATRLEYHPIGAALEFKAALVKSDRGAERTNIAAHYRVITDGSRGSERTALLSPQPGMIDATTTDGIVSGTLFERLIEPTGLTAGATRTDIAGTKMELEYWFESDDDATAAKRILLVDPPAVVHATANVTLPEYAAKMLGTGSSGAGAGGAQTIDLGAGSDDRAAPAPILAGSHVSVALEFNKPLTVPAPLDVSSEEAARWVQATLGPEAMLLFSKPESGPAPQATLVGSGKTWTLAWQHWESVRLIVKPTDEYHIAAAEEANFRFDALKDNPPTASVTTPAEDKSVLATAIVEIAGEARDDVALDWVALERQQARKNAASEANTPEAKADRVEITRMLASEQPREPGDVSPASLSIKRLVSTYQLDLSTIPELQPGDEVWITALASDAFNLEGQRHEAVRSTVRKLRILSREQLVEQIWNELSAARRTAIKIDQDQQDIAKVKPPAGPTGEELSARAERAQAGLTERLSRQNQAVARLQQRVKENGLTDQNVQDVLKQASESLARAGEHSAKGSQNLGEAARQQTQEGAKEKAGEPELGKATEEQKAVRDELSKLIDMLDQGEDSFASKRALERLLDEQKALRDRTGQTGRQTAGKTPEQLSPEQQAELDKIAQEQKSLADQLRDQVRKMQDRESKVREKDAAAAEAMAQAAAQATRDQTPERMEEASKQAQKNQTSSSQQQQSEAIQSMEQMLEKMEQAQKNKDEVLKRALASLIDSLKGLIQVQEISIGALKEATPKGTDQVKTLEQPMIAHLQNVLGVMDQANSSGAREIGPVVEKIEKASDEIGATIPDLRDAHAEPALGHEEAALKSLQEALEIAEKLNQKAEQQASARKRAELRSKYEAAMKTQVQLRDAAQGLVGAEDNRRNKATARKLGEEQAALNVVVDAIRDESKDLAGAKTFLYAHTRLDDLMKSATTTLSGGAADAPVLRNQTAAARVLKSLADALDDRKPPDDPFRGQQSSSGGGGGGGGDQPTVPDAAEIVLLRLMQVEALDMARGAAEAREPDAATTGEAAKLQRDLAEQGALLLQKLSEKTGGGLPGPKTKKLGPDKPGDKPEEPGDEKPADKPEEPADGGKPQ